MTESEKGWRVDAPDINQYLKRRFPFSEGCLVTAKLSIDGLVTYHTVPAIYTKGGWRGTSLDKLKLYGDVSVIAWQPMPEPYEEAK